MLFTLKTAAYGITPSEVGYGLPVGLDTGESRYAVLFLGTADHAAVRLLLTADEVSVVDASSTGESTYNGS